MFDTLQKEKSEHIERNQDESPEVQNSLRTSEPQNGEKTNKPLVSIHQKLPAAKAGIVTVNTLFHGETYEIPSYQREFTWGREQVEALLGDLVEAFESRIAQSNKPQYFLGALVTQVREQNDEGDIDVADKIVDGQQRVTSLMLIIAVLCKHLASSVDPSEAKEGIWQGEQKRLLGLIYRNEAEHFVLDVSGYNYYLRKLMGGSGILPDKRLGNPPFKTSALQKFEKAFEIFEAGILREVGEIDASDPESNPNLYNLAHFSAWLTEGVFMALIQDTDPYDDQRLFDRMNTRGMPLSEGEKFKSRVLSSANLESSNQASKRWQKNQDFALQSLNAAGQKGSLAVRDSREAERRLLGGWIIANLFKDCEINEEKIKLARSIELDPYDYCLKELDPQPNASRPSQLFQLLSSRFFNCVKKTKRHKAYLGAYKFVPKFAGLQHAQVTKIPFLDAAISACFMARPANHHVKRLSTLSGFVDLLAFHSMWNTRWIDKPRLKESMLAAVQTIMAGNTQTLRQELTRILGNLPPIEQSRAPSLSDTNKRWIRYFLGRMAWELEDRAFKAAPPVEYINGTGKRSPEIEHIFSKRYYDEGSAFGFSRDEIEIYRQKLGALTLLAREDNREASNKAWDQRTAIYQRSNLLTRTLLATTYGNELQISGTRTDLSFLKFEPWPSITPSAIKARQEAYTNLARDIWSTGTFLSKG